jgi:hypothetical protein
VGYFQWVYCNSGLVTGRKAAFRVDAQSFDALSSFLQGLRLSIRACELRSGDQGLSVRPSRLGNYTNS